MIIGYHNLDTLTINMVSKYINPKRQWTGPTEKGGIFHQIQLKFLTPDFSCMRATKTQTRLHKRAFSQEHCTKHKLCKLSKYHTNIISSSEGSCAHSGRNIHCYKINGKIMIVERKGKYALIFFINFPKIRLHLTLLRPSSEGSYQTVHACILAKTLTSTNG